MSFFLFRLAVNVIFIEGIPNIPTFKATRVRGELDLDVERK
jgi:hypothetical protein